MTVRVGQDEGTPIGGGGVIRVRGEQTGGALAVLEVSLAPKRLIGHHVHTNDVWVQVLEGEVGVRVGDEIAVGTPGCWLLKPRDVPHAMWNPGAERARYFEFLTPAGSEPFFEEVQHIAEGDDSSFYALAQRYGITFFPDSPWNDELRALL